MIKKKLKVYQQKVVNVLKAMETEYGNFSTIMELPTGAGKTLTAIDYIVSQALENQCKVLWLTHRDLLLQQAQNELNKETGEKYKSKCVIVSGKSGNLSRVDEKVDVIFGSIFSMTLRIKPDKSNKNGVSAFSKWLAKSKEDGKRLYIIIDEAHHVGSNTYDNLLEDMLLPDKNNKVLVERYALVGLTATPFREDSEELRLMKWFKHGYEKEFKLDNVEDVDSAEAQKYLACEKQDFRMIDSEIGEDVEIVNRRVIDWNNRKFGNLIRVVELQDLIRLKVLVEPYFYRVDDFENDGINENNLDGVSESIVENIKNSNNLGKTVIFVPRKKMADKIAELLNQSGVACLSITAEGVKDFKDNENDKDQKKDKNNPKDDKNKDKDGKDKDIFDIYEVKFIATVDVISEGFNVEDLNTVILATGTTSRNRLRQRIGRVVRGIEDKDKKARVIWYYIADSKDEEKVGNYLTNNQGYKKSNDDETDENRQSDESVAHDRKRKTYYLTAPKYGMPMGYALEYPSSAYREYVDFLHILALFQDNKDIESFIGYYRLEDSFGIPIRISLDKVLLDGFQHLFRRVRSQWLILRDNEKFVDNITDFTNELGISILDYVSDAMKVCFFLCKPKKNSVFYANREIIEVFIDAVLRNNGNEPELITLHRDILDFVNQICDGVLDDVSPEEILEEALRSDKKISIHNEEPKHIEIIYDEIFKDYGLSDDVQRDMILEGIEAVLAGRKKELKNEVDKICEENNCESIGDVQFSSLLKTIIAHDKVQSIKSYKDNRGKNKKEHTKELRVDNYINYELEDLADEIKKYRTNWSNKPVTYDYNGVKRVFAWVDLDKSKLSNNYDLEHNTLRLPRRPAISSTMAICQSILINTHHLVVSEDDAKKYEEAIESFVKALGVTINGQYDDLARDIVCRLGYEMENVADRPYFKSLIKFFKCKKIHIPRFFAYLMYDIVYESVWREVDFLRSDGVVSSYCQNEVVLTNIKDTILQGYKLPVGFFDKYNLQPVADAIFDYRPYTKVLRNYLGIKPDLLCRMMNLIAKQAPECNHFITGCGGSAAGLINRFNPINDNIKKETYNEYGYLLTNFYLVLQDNNKYQELLDKISLFVDLLCNCDTTGVKEKFTDSIFNYFSKNDWENDKEEKFKTVFKFSEIPDSQTYDILAIGEVTRDYASDDELVNKFLHNNPAINLHYIYKNGHDEEVAFKDAKSDIQTRENVLHGVYRIYEQFYLWCQKAENDEDIRITGLNDVELAFVVYLFYSFPGRYRFDDCHIASFVKFASSYEQNIKMGHERVEKWNIYNPTDRDKKRDVNEVLRLHAYNKNTSIAYCDIPYAETSDSLYVAKTFDFKKFVDNLDNFEGKYIVSSRYNICTFQEFKALYYIWEHFIESEKIDVKEVATKSHRKLITSIIKKINTDDDFTENDKENLRKSLTPQNEEKVWQYLLDNATQLKVAHIIESFKENKIIIASQDDIKTLLGNTAYNQKIKNIYDFYKSFADMKKNKPKYIVIPYTNTEEILSDANKLPIRKVRNNYRLRDYDVDIMFKNTIFSNIPVEVMVTNVEMLNKVSEESPLLDTYDSSEESHLLNTYRISDGVFALPTVRADASSSSYLAEPIYLVLTYDRYMEYMKENLMRDDNEDARESAEIFRSYLATRDDL